MLFVATMLFLALINQMELRPRKLTPGNRREVFCNRTPEGQKGKRMDQRFALKNDWMIGLRFYSQRHKAFSRIYAGIFQLFPGQDQSTRKFNLFPFICRYQIFQFFFCDWSRKSCTHILRIIRNKRYEY